MMKKTLSSGRIKASAIREEQADEQHDSTLQRIDDLMRDASGSDFRAKQRAAPSAVLRAYGATPCAVLRQRMVLRHMRQHHTLSRYWERVGATTCAVPHHKLSQYRAVPYAMIGTERAYGSTPSAVLIEGMGQDAFESLADVMLGDFK
eukprot:568918-Rhodomonas_salina.2